MTFRTWVFLGRKRRSKNCFV